MIKFYRTGVLGQVYSDHYVVTREVLTQTQVRNWIGILHRENPARAKAVWERIEQDANRERPVSNDIDVTRMTLEGKELALIAGIKINGNSPVSGKIQGAFKYIIVEDKDLIETLRQEFGAKIKRGAKWEDVRQEEILRK